MSTTAVPKPSREMGPSCVARLAGIVYVLVFVAGIYALVGSRGRAVANLIAGVCYVAVTLLFYYIFKPAGRKLSLLAALVSLTGCVLGALMSFNRAPINIHPLVFFGVYCLLIGYLILRSTFLPRFLGVLMMFGGLGWLTFAFPGFAASLFPWNLAPGIIGEGALTLWLVVMSVNEAAWKDQALAGSRV